MKYDAFAKAMGQIEREDDALKQKEQADTIRAARFAKIRKAFLTLVGIVLVVAAYTHRQELGQKIQKLTRNQAAAPDDKMAKDFKEIRGAADKRDNALDELTKR